MRTKMTIMALVAGILAASLAWAATTITTNYYCSRCGSRDLTITHNGVVVERFERNVAIDSLIQTEMRKFPIQSAEGNYVITCNKCSYSVVFAPEPTLAGKPMAPRRP